MKATPESNDRETSPLDPSFDPAWYLSQYPDVAASGLDPWFHYCRFGKSEGRLPYPNAVPVLEHWLWRGAHEVVLHKLEQILEDCDTQTAENSYIYDGSHRPLQSQQVISARWALARWYAHQKNWQNVLETLCPDGQLIEAEFVGIPLLALEAANHFAATQFVDLAQALSQCSFLSSSSITVSSKSLTQSAALSPPSSIAPFDSILRALKTGFSQHSDTALALANAVLLFKCLEKAQSDRDMSLEFDQLRELLGVESLGASKRFGLQGVSTDHGDDRVSNDSRFAKCDHLRLRWINSVFANAGLAVVNKRLTDQRLTIDNLVKAGSDQSISRSSPENPLSDLRPLISVIIPMHNAGQGIQTALLSLFEQTWRPLEIIVVDDSSIDDSVAIVSRLQSQLCNQLDAQLQGDVCAQSNAQFRAEFCTESPDGLSLSLIRSKSNRGAYAARNLGLANATGEFVTVHDSDDWSHPQKLEKQVLKLLESPSLRGCFSHWVRASKDLVFTHWRIEPDGWTYRNMSSLMCRHSVFDALGSWDEVKVNGDTEFHERLVKIFGLDAVTDVLPGVPLSFGRISHDSLSQANDTHLITQYRGVRHDYMASARRWHEAFAIEHRADGVAADNAPSAQSPDTGSRCPRRLRTRGSQAAPDLRSGLYLPACSGYRPFPAPSVICPDSLKTRFIHPLDEIQASGLFDAAWYIRNYLDLQKHIIDPLQHYWEVGAREGRDPGPNFSTTGYLALNSQSVGGDNPLLHFIRRAVKVGKSGKDSGRNDKRASAEPVLTEVKVKALPQSSMREALPVFIGEVKHKRSSPTVMLVGHAAGGMLYGAERSLVDVARSIHALGLNLVVVLPTAINASYIQTLQACSSSVAVMPFGWWQRGKGAEETTVDHFIRLIDQYRVDLVHVNTLVLNEPLVAARQRGIPCLVHVRELLEHDETLRDDLNVTASEMRQRLLCMTDGLIANSLQVLRWLCDGSSASTADTATAELASKSKTTHTQSERASTNRSANGNREESALGSPGDLGAKPDGGFGGFRESERRGANADQDSIRLPNDLIFQVTNTVDMGRLLALPMQRKQASTRRRSSNLVVGMISSNHPKKGLNDVFEIASCLELIDANVSLVLFGPETAELRVLLDRHSARGNRQHTGSVKGARQPGGAGSNIRIRYGGYVADPADALAKVDVLINVSRFQESFGRTALEAMAAAKPVVGYRWGALPELVVDGKTGYLVPLGDHQAIADCLIRLSQNKALRIRLGHAGRRRAVSLFSSTRLCEQLRKVYEAFGLITSLPSH